MAGVPLTADQASMMLEKVRRDRSLRPALRTRAIRIAAGAGHPVRALRKIQAVAVAELPSIPRVPPTMDLARVVGAAVFWEFMSKPEVREAFMTPSDFIRYVDTSSDPSGVLWEFLSDDPVLFHWTRSWLAESPLLRGLDGECNRSSLGVGVAAAFRDLPSVRKRSA